MYDDLDYKYQLNNSYSDLELTNFNSKQLESMKTENKAKKALLLEKEKQQIRIQKKQLEKNKKYRTYRRSFSRSARSFSTRAFGLIPILIIVSIIAMISSSATIYSEKVIVGDKEYVYKRISADDSILIGSKLFLFSNDVITGISVTGDNMKHLVFKADGSLRLDVFKLVSGFFVSVTSFLLDPLNSIETALVENGYNPQDSASLPDDMNGDGKVTWWDYVLKGLVSLGNTLGNG